MCVYNHHYIPYNTILLLLWYCLCGRTQLLLLLLFSSAVAIVVVAASTYKSINHTSQLRRPQIVKQVQVPIQEAHSHFVYSGSRPKRLTATITQRNYYCCYYYYHYLHQLVGTYIPITRLTVYNSIIIRHMICVCVQDEVHNTTTRIYNLVFLCGANTIMHTTIKI